MKSRIEIVCCGRQYKHVHGQECPRQRRLQLTVRVCVCVCKYPRILHWREEIQLATLEWSEPPQRRVLITNQYWSETSVWEASCLSSPAPALFSYRYMFPFDFLCTSFELRPQTRFTVSHFISLLSWLILFTGSLYALPVMLLYG